MRNLTKALAAVSLLVPASGHSLGIGDIKLHSALNQNLKAEIALVVSANEDVSDIKVRLAAPEKFDEAGVPWSYFLSKIKFKTETQSNGNVVVKVTSSEALKEPFLDMLLEVSWPKGSLYREFTVLVDPSPTYAQPKSVVYKKQPKAAVADKKTALNFAQEKKYNSVKKSSRSSAKDEPDQSAFQPVSLAPAEKATAKIDSLGAEESSKSAEKIDSLGVDSEPRGKATSKIDALGFDDASAKVAPVVASKVKPAVAKAKNQRAPMPVVTQKTKTTSDAVTSDKDGAIKGIAKDKTTKDTTAAIETSAKQYGPTKKKSNLYRIAKEVNSDPDISVEQMMYAIYNANPEAFYDDNINSLRANQQLKIPTRDAILKTSTGTPKKTTKLHDKAESEVASTSKAEPIEAKKIPLKTKKHIATKLKLSPPHANKIAKKHEVAPTAAIEQEDSSKLSNANQDLQIQLKKMQEQLATMQNLLSIKEQKLALLQKQLEDKKLTETKSSSEKTVMEKKVLADKAIADAKTAAEKKALEDKAKAKAEADKIAADKAIADAKTATEKKALEDKAKAKAEADKIAADKAIAAAKTAAEKKALEDKAKAKAETDKIAADKAIADAKTAAEKKALEDKAKAKAEADKIAADKAIADAKTAAEKKALEDKAKAKAEADKIAADKAIADAKTAAEKKALEDKAKAKAEADKIAADKAIADAKTAAEKKALEDKAKAKAEADKIAADKAIADAKTAAEKKALEDKAKATAPPQVTAPAAQVSPPAMVAQVAPKKPLIVVAPEPVEEDWMTDPYTLAAAGGGVLSLGVLGWLFWRKRKVESTAEVESMFTESSEINLPNDEDEFSVPGIDEASSFMFGGESSFLSDDNDFDAFEVDQDEIDPISEADVYLAYGRYQQAEELIRQAIEDLPDRDECKFKLLEIFCVNGNAQGFEQYVQELASAGKMSNRSFWSKVIEMGREIIPNSPLLTMSEGSEDTGEHETVNKLDDAVAAATLRKALALDDDDFESDISIFDNSDEEKQDGNLTKTALTNKDISQTTLNKSQEQLTSDDDLDLSIFDEEESVTGKSYAAGSDADFDLSVFDDEVSAEKAEPVKDQESPANNMEFDLSMFGDEVPAAKTEPVKDQESPANNMEFDLSMFDDEAPAAKAEPVKDQEPPANNMEFDLSMFDDEAPAAKAEPVKDQEPPANNMEFDLSMFDDEAPAAKAEPVKDQEPPANNMEFDLSMFDDEAPAAKAEPVKDQEVPANNVEFDLPAFDAVKLDNTSAELDLSDFGDAGEFFDSESEKADSDFDLSSFDALETANATSAEPEIEFDLSDFDGISESFDSESEKTESDFDLSAFDSDDFDLLSDSKNANATTLSSGDDEIEFDLSLFDINEENTSNTLSDTFNFDDASGSSSKKDDSADLDNMNILETKLDLAKAYIDMGDLDAAKVIAEKVLVEGNNEQKAVAQEILNSLR